MLYCLELQDFESEPSLMAMFSPYYLVPDEKAEAVRLKKQSIDSLEKSLALAPDHLPTYRLLFETHERFGNEAASEAAAQHYRAVPRRFRKRRGSWPIAARLKTSSISRSPIFRRRVQKPLDHSLRERESTIRIGLARCRALEKRWEDGRSQFLAAEELAPDLRKEYIACAKSVVRGQGRPARCERPVPEGGHGFPRRSHAALVGAHDRVHSAIASPPR